VIYEGVVTTVAADGGAHVTPLGWRQDEAMIELAPFVPSSTLDNLRRVPHAVINLVDDVRIIAGCLTGRRDWPVLPAERIEGWRLADVVGHRELSVRSVHEDAERPRFRCAIVHSAEHRPWQGYNRAQGAVIEAAILVSRLDWLEPARVACEMAYLAHAVERTAGAREHEAWRWLVAAVAGHPRHGAAAAG